MTIRIQTVFKGIRMPEVLAAQCETAAAKAGIPFSKWARQSFRHALARQLRRKTNGR